MDGNRTVEKNSFLSPETNILVTILLTLLFAASLVGNSLVIAVVYRNVNKKMRTTTNLFVVSMAASDILTTVVTIPILYWMFHTSSESHDESAEFFVFCKIISAVWIITSGVSVLSLVAISLDRFWAVFFPTKRPLTSRKPSVVVTAVWLFCICFGTIPILVTPVECGAQLNSLYISFSYLYVVLYMGIPTASILVLYPAILIKLWCRRIPGNPSIANNELRNRTNRKVTILAAALTISFAFSWFPLFAMKMKSLLEKPNTNQKEDKIFPRVATVLMYSSCLWNPLMCIVLNANFRSGFKTILGAFCNCCSVSNSNCCKRKNEITNLSSMAMDFGQELNVIQLTAIKK